MTVLSDGKRKPRLPQDDTTESVKTFNPIYLVLESQVFQVPETEKRVRVDEASDEEFDAFIRQYVEIGWTLEERIDVLIKALEDGQNVIFIENGDEPAEPSEI